MSARRADAGAAVAGLFDRPSATGGLAGRDRAAPADPAPTAEQPATPTSHGGGPPETTEVDAPRPAAASGLRPRPAGPRERPVTRVRLGVELTEQDTGYLRSLSRPARTGGPRTLGSKFVATGVLAAAIELLRSTDVDMHGVDAGDLAEMTLRARDALIRAVLRGQVGEASG